MTIRVLALLLGGWIMSAVANSPEDSVWMLEHGPEDAWPGAIHALMEHKQGIPPRAIASVLRRHAVLNVPERVRLISTLGRGYARYDPRVLAFLAEQITSATDDASLADAALKVLLKSRATHAIPVLETLKGLRPDLAMPIEKRLSQLQALHAQPNEEVRNPNPDADRTPVGIYLLSLFAAVSALLGIVILLWVLRMMQLRRLLKGLAVIPVHSVAQGTALLHGQLYPLNNQLLDHPVTGEACLYFPNADQYFPHHRFYLQDDSGRIVIDPRGAILLSEETILLPGSPVTVLGHISRLSESTGPNPAGLTISKPRVKRSWFARAGHFLVQGVLGFWWNTDQARALFSDPKRCFWIWSDEQANPAGAWVGMPRLTVVSLLAGSWIVLFSSEALTLFDQW